MIQVTGTLTAHAEFRKTPSGGALVIARVQPPGPGFPFEAVVSCGSGVDADLAAERMAARFRKGATAKATGRVARPRTDHSYAAIVLEGEVTLSCE